MARRRTRHVALPLPRRAAHDARDDRHLPGVEAAAVKRRMLVSAAVVAAVSAVPARADTTSVQILDSGYNPPRAVALAGDTVGWRNSSFVNQHTVTSAGFDSGPIVPGGGFFHDFPTSGTYLYA